METENFSVEEEDIMKDIEKTFIRSCGYSNEEVEIMNCICKDDYNEIIIKGSYVDKYLDETIKSLDLMFGDSNIVFEYLNQKFSNPRDWLENLYFIEDYGLTKGIVEEISK